MNYYSTSCSGVSERVTEVLYYIHTFTLRRSRMGCGVLMYTFYNAHSIPYTIPIDRSINR